MIKCPALLLHASIEQQVFDAFVADFTCLQPNFIYFIF